MTYLSEITVNKVNAQLYHSKLSFIGNTSLNDYLTITTPLYSNITLTQNSDNLIFSSGHYMISAVVGVNNSNNVANNINARLEVDSTLIGNIGSSVQLNKVGGDAAHANITVATGSTATLKVKITTQNGTTSINTDLSSLIIKRVPI